jgi:hypothetical protein
MISKKSVFHYYDKFFFKQWIIGFIRGELKEIISKRTFDDEITWLNLFPKGCSSADPFIIMREDNKLHLIFEEYHHNEDYGKISLIILDNDFKVLKQKVLLDTKSHLSYPYIFREENKIYIFPESASSGKLLCYEYDPIHQSLQFVKEIMSQPLLDATIIKYRRKYWLFGTLKGENSWRKLNLYFSDSLFGPYKSHPSNPVKDTLYGSRPAGTIIESDGILYRPAQNCQNMYGESITINKVTVLTETQYMEETHMVIEIDRKKRYNHMVCGIHTINSVNGLITVDGYKCIFSPILLVKEHLKG